MLRFTAMDSGQWVRLAVALVVLCFLGSASTLGVGGVHGIARYVFGPIFISLGLVGMHLQLKERRRWCSLQRGEDTWMVEVGCGTRVLKVTEISIRGAAGRIDRDEGGYFALLGAHVLVYDSLTRHDEPLTTALVGEGLGHAASTLEAICDVLTVEAKVRRAVHEAGSEA